MPLKPAPQPEALVGINGKPTQTWQLWFNAIYRMLSGGEPMPLASYTVAGVPSAAAFTGNLIYVTNESGGATIAFSDGTNWRRVQDRNIIT